MMRRSVIRESIKNAAVRSIGLGLGIYKNRPTTGKYRGVKTLLRSVRSEIESFAEEVWDSFPVDDQLVMVGWVNEHFPPRAEVAMSIAGFGRHFQMERQTLQNVWMSKEEAAIGEEAERYFNQPAMCKGPPLPRDTAIQWPVDFAPAKTEAEALALLRTGKYRWSLVDDDATKGTRKIGLTVIQVDPGRGYTPIREPDFATIGEAVMVIHPMNRTILPPVDIVNDEAYLEAMAKVAATVDELAEIQAMQEKLGLAVATDKG